MLAVGCRIHPFDAGPTEPVMAKETAAAGSAVKLMTERAANERANRATDDQAENAAADFTDPCHPRSLVNIPTENILYRGKR